MVHKDVGHDAFAAFSEYFHAGDKAFGFSLRHNERYFVVEFQLLIGKQIAATCDPSLPEEGLSMPLAVCLAFGSSYKKGARGTGRRPRDVVGRVAGHDRRSPFDAFQYAEMPL